MATLVYYSTHFRYSCGVPEDRMLGKGSRNVKKFARVIVPVLVIAVAVSAFVYLQATRPLATPNPVSEKAWPVSVFEARMTDERPVIQEFGTVVAGSVVELRPLVAGRIVQLGKNFVEGATVRRGETLVVVDPFDYEIEVADKEAAVASSMAQLKEIRSDLRAQRQLLEIALEQVELRRTDLERKRKLRTGDTVSRKVQDDAQIAYNEARQAAEGHQQTCDRLVARTEQMNASLARHRAALKLARRHLGDTRLVAPEDGYLAGVVAAVGQRVGGNDRLARLIVAHRLEVLFQLSRRDFGRLAGSTEPQEGQPLVGSPVSVTWRIGQQSFHYDAVIERLGAEIDAGSGGVSIHARILEPGLQSPLRPGAFIEVGVPGKLYRNVFRLPEAAIHDDRTVYAVNEDRLTAHPVQVLRRVAKDVLVHAGFPPGTKVVVTQFPEIGPGLKVKAR